MAATSRLRPIHGLVLVFVLIPVVKLVAPLFRSGPKTVSPAAMAAGRELFTHEWTTRDTLTKGDGLGPVHNALSCVECHHQGGPGGGGPVAKNVTVYGLVNPHPKGIAQSGVVHQHAVRPEFQETLRLVHPSLPNEPFIPLEILTDRSRRRNPEVVVTQRNTPALFGDGLIDAVPDETLLAHQREHSTAARLVGLSGARDGKTRGRIARLADGRIGRFGWKAEFASLSDFVKAACANELGLSNPGRPQATPLGRQSYRAPGEDLTDAQCILMTDFIRGLATPRQVIPAERREAALVKAGQERFRAIGCADCHSQDLGPVAGIYSDMLLHDMGIELESSTGYYGSIIPQPAIQNDKFASTEQPSPAEWRTDPLWGVADSAPYLHDGRANSLREAIELHGGEARDVTARFREAPPLDQEAILAFLRSLRAPLSDSLAVRGEASVSRGFAALP